MAICVRVATAGDYRPCAAIDRGYTTSTVWQMEYRFDGFDANQGTVCFRTVRLPRPLTVVESPPADALIREWLRAAGFFVAADELSDRIVGFLAVEADAERRIARVSDLVVRPEQRGQGIGSRLVGELRRWAREQGFQTLLAETQTRNYPALRFLMKNGFAFCGFHEQAHRGREIVVYFAATV
ncbi:MAG: GNAT family N-acetyltransferase [Chloroflexi bacterium]|nr:GNAT family N-acetyltransferase [Chloroflexota bacterium]